MSHSDSALGDRVRVGSEPIIGPFGGKWPEIAPDAFVAPGAAVIGDVTVGAGANIWYGCVLRGDDHWIRLGAGSNVQDGTVIHVTLDQHPTDIGEGVTIGHGVRLHGCTLKDGCMVGIGAVALDAAIVESGAILAAGAVLTPGKTVPSGQLWAGNPARFLRKINDAEREFLARNSRHYLRLAKRYLSVTP